MRSVSADPVPGTPWQRVSVAAALDLCRACLILLFVCPNGGIGGQLTGCGVAGFATLWKESVLTGTLAKALRGAS